MARRGKDDLIDLRLDKGQLTVLVVAALAVAAMVFFLGVVVGRRMAEISPEEAAARGKSAAGPTSAGGSGVAGVGDMKPDPLAQLDERAAKDAKKAAVGPASAGGSEPSGAAGEKKPEAGEKKPEAGEKKPEAGEKKPEAEEKPASGNFVLQVASVRKQESAEAEVKRLRTRGYKVKVLEADLGAKGKWYRVLVGEFSTREEAEVFKKEFEVKETRPGTLVKQIK